MAFLTDKEIEERLKSPENLANRVTIHEKPVRGPQVPTEIKKEIIALAGEGHTQASLASRYSLPLSSVHNYVHGRIQEPEVKEVAQSVKKASDAKRKKAEDEAIDVVLAAIGVLNQPGKVAMLKARDIASIAKDMATIADKIRPAEEKEKENQVHLHLYRPHMKSVDDYEVVEAV